MPLRAPKFKIIQIFFTENKRPKIEILAQERYLSASDIYHREDILSTRKHARVYYHETR